MRRHFLKYLGFGYSDEKLDIGSVADRLAEETQQEIMIERDKLLFGKAFKDAETGKRVDPTTVRMSQEGNSFWVVKAGNIAKKVNLVEIL